MVLFGGVGGGGEGVCRRIWETPSTMGDVSIMNDLNSVN